jgi:hypothetical protein
MSRNPRVAVLGVRAMAPGKARLRDGQKPYVLPAAIGSIPAGTVIGVDQGIPDAILDRLNRLPLMDCISTCAGGHRPWELRNGVEKLARALRGPKWAYPTVLFGCNAKAGFNLVKTGKEEAAKPGRFTLPGLGEGGGQYLIYPDMPFLWIAAPFFYPAPTEWWEGLCQILEAAKFVEVKKRRHTSRSTRRIGRGGR